jgi:hypothetical protein
VARLAALIAAAVLALLPAAAAQGYPVLHVVALSQRADRATVEPGGVFVVTLHVKITQRRDRLDELILGSFVNCEIISNETVRTAVPDGTDFVERLTLQALAPGAATISPAYIDAVDPGAGRPMRFSSNAVRVEVAGSPLAGARHWFGISLRRLATAVALVAGAFAAAFVLYTLFVRRRRTKPVPVPAPAAPPLPPRELPGSERLVQAAQRFRHERSQAALLDVRAVLFGIAGVAAGATLVDALRALGDRDVNVRAALLAAESAAFGPAAERGGAGDALLAAIAAYGGEAAPPETAWTR